MTAHTEEDGIQVLVHRGQYKPCSSWYEKRILCTDCERIFSGEYPYG